MPSVRQPRSATRKAEGASDADDHTAVTVRFPKPLLRRVRGLLARRKKSGAAAASQNAWICEAVAWACRAQEDVDLTDERHRRLAEEIEKLKALTAQAKDGGAPPLSITEMTAEAIGTFRRLHALMEEPPAEAAASFGSNVLGAVLAQIRDSLTPSAARRLADIFASPVATGAPVPGVELFVTSSNVALHDDIRALDLPFGVHFYAAPTDRREPFIRLFVDPDLREGASFKLRLRRFEALEGDATSASDVWWIPGDAGSVANVRELILHLASVPTPPAPPEGVATR